MTEAKPYDDNELDAQLNRASLQFGNYLSFLKTSLPYFYFQLPITAIHFIYENIRPENLRYHVTKLMSIFDQLEFEVNRYDYECINPTYQLPQTVYNHTLFRRLSRRPYRRGNEHEVKKYTLEDNITSLIIGFYFEIFDKLRHRQFLPQFENLNYFKYLSDSFFIFNVEHYNDVLASFTFAEDPTKKIFRFFFFMNFLLKYYSLIFSSNKTPTKYKYKLIAPDHLWEDFFFNGLKDLSFDMMFYIFLACQATNTIFTLRYIALLLTANQDIPYKDKCLMNLLIYATKNYSNSPKLYLCPELFEDSISLFCIKRVSRGSISGRVVEKRRFPFLNLILHLTCEDFLSEMHKINLYIWQIVEKKELWNINSFFNFRQLIEINEHDKKFLCKEALVKEFFKLFERKKNYLYPCDEITPRIIIPRSFANFEMEIKKIRNKTQFSMSINDDESKILGDIISSSSSSSSAIVFPHMEIMTEIPQIQVKKKINIKPQFILKVEYSGILIKWRFQVTGIKVSFHINQLSEKSSETIVRIINSYNDESHVEFSLSLNSKFLCEEFFERIKSKIKNVTIIFHQDAHNANNTLKQICKIFLHKDITLQVKGNLVFCYYSKFRAVHIRKRMNISKAHERIYSRYFDMIRKLLSKVSLTYIYLEHEVLLYPELMYTQFISSCVIKNLGQVFISYSNAKKSNMNYVKFYQGLQEHQIKLTIVYQSKLCDENDFRMLCLLGNFEMINFSQKSIFSRLERYLQGSSGNSVHIYTYNFIPSITHFRQRNIEEEEKGKIIINNDIHLRTFVTELPIFELIKKKNILSLFPHIKFKSQISYLTLKNLQGSIKGDEFYIFLYCRSKNQKMRNFKHITINLIRRFLIRRYHYVEQIPQFKLI